MKKILIFICLALISFAIALIALNIGSLAEWLREFPYEVILWVLFGAILKTIADFIGGDSPKK